MLSHPAVAEQVPSGQQVSFFDAFTTDVGDETWLRLRFLTPQIARGTGSVDFATAAEDMEALCAGYALDYIAGNDLSPDKIAITFSDRPVDFGVADPEATQFIEVYSLEQGRCVWEAF